MCDADDTGAIAVVLSCFNFTVKHSCLDICTLSCLLPISHDKCCKTAVKMKKQLCLQVVQCSYTHLSSSERCKGLLVKIEFEMFTIE